MNTEKMIVYSAKKFLKMTWKQRFWLSILALIIIFIASIFTVPFMPPEPDPSLVPEPTTFQKYMNYLFIIEMLVFFVLALFASYSLGRSYNQLIIKE